MRTGAPVSFAYSKNSSSPAFLLFPYSLSLKRPSNVAWMLLESMTGHLLLCFLSVSSSVDAKPKLPFMNSSLSLGLLTPARLNTMSQSLQ